MRTEDAMRRNEEGYSTNCYYAYGPHAWESEYENDSAPQSRVLVMKDSFGTPVAAFLSNAVGELLATDQRKTTLSAENMWSNISPTRWWWCIARTCCGRRIMRLWMNEPLKAHTTFQIGGPAEELAAPESEEELARVARARAGAGSGRGQQFAGARRGRRGAYCAAGQGLCAHRNRGRNPFSRRRARGFRI